ncbi:hypothetical protein lerEdw1_014045 [Lerista edwardsae]|nr:hypothetical protein lerEdw1_014045 [Lerista edwardsae]
MHARMAAAEAGLQDKAGARPLSGLCGRPGDSGRLFPEENGAADRPSEQSDASFAAAEQSRPQAPTGKLKKTAFKLFGGKRSICTLPSLFGGKNRGQGKGASKKGLSKSRTHDGISEVGYEGTSARRLRSPSDGGAEFPPPQLPASQSALLTTDAQQSASLSGSSEGFEKKLNGGDKALFLPRPKKGLKGLFNSIRRHRKNKAAEPERTELQDWVCTGAAPEEQAPTGSGQVGVEIREAPPKGSLKGVVLPSDSGENFQSGTLPGMAGSPGESREGDQLGADGRSPEGGSATGAAGSEGVQDVEADVDSVLCTGSTYDGLPDALQRPEDLDGILPSVPSGDQISLMFGDVTSLKSFDSFTGCGDIIAEPDIDSIAESSTSAERSRDAPKRSSCLVTYQGGGEEMAVPDGIEEYLQQVWEGAIKADASYDAPVPELVANCALPGVTVGKPEAHLYVEGTRNDMDLPTPHSDQQESAPNSDEGYYDSTTPGPEDEAGEGLEEIKKDRLPRDSYSGDALYEFYEPDDVLMSPSHRDECWFDRKASPPEIFSQFLDFALPAEKDLARMMGRKSDGMETEGERLAAVQKQLLYWGMRREPVLKHLQMLHQDQHPQEKQRPECTTRVADLMGSKPGCLGCEQVDPHALNSSLGTEDPLESQDWKEHPESASPEKHHNGSCSLKAHSSYLIQLMENGSMLDSSLGHLAFESCALSGLALEKSVTYPFYRTHGCHSCPPSEPSSRTVPGFREPQMESRSEPEQAVNFSQALVEFTSSGTLFSSLSESLGSSNSGSAFTQNLPALPTMVTFDIVDVEQDGEGECEQHLEMNTEEDIAASFEAFDDSYLPKESFAVCDERMFPGYGLSTFQSCNWGVASLPRCLRLQEVGGAEPEPLSVCRRSRSLDTESLEFELANLELPKNGLKPCELWSKWSGFKKDSVGQENCTSSPEEVDGDNGVPSWPGLQNVSYGEELSSQGGKPWDGDLNVPAFHSTWGMLKEPPFVTLADNASKEATGRPRDDGANSRVHQVPRPSNLPLQTPVAPHEAPAVHRPAGDHMAKKHAWVLPVGDADCDLPPTFGLRGSPDKPAMCKPVGVAQGVSQLHRSNAEAFEDEDQRGGNSEAELLKGGASRWNSSPASGQSATMNVTVAK